MTPPLLEIPQVPLGVLLAAALTAASGVAWANPNAPEVFCGVYPEAPACADATALCTTCHTVPPGRNVFGVQLEKALMPGETRPLSDEVFLAGLADALAEVEALDADADGFTNLEELLQGTAPDDARSRPIVGDCPRSIAANGWDVCGYDHRYVFKKLHLDVCGHSPSRAAVEAFEASGDRLAALHDALDVCLESEFWRGRDGQVWNLGNRKIKPLKSIKSGEDQAEIPLADYLDDYAFFVYANTGDRDVRDVLLGTYFVEQEPSEDGTRTVYTPWNRDPFSDRDARGNLRAQLVFEFKRAGLLTHRWFLMYQVMFTGVPRTAAAHAYRAFLGYDIGRLEGLFPVDEELIDYDNKGVTQPECARCHTTLDPLTYPFSRYEGIQGGDGPFRIPFSYNAARHEAFVNTDGPLMTELPEAGHLFGQPVADLLEWAQVAAASEPFARATVLDYWRLLVGEDPRPEEQAEYEALWRGLMTTHEYNIERMLHALIETEAYGVP